MIKLFGIGNILLCDDAIGVRIAEKLKSYLISKSDLIEIIIGETDFLYCLSCVEPNDRVIIIDSTYLDLPPATISFFTLSEYNKFFKSPYLAHEVTFLSMLIHDYPNISGYFIGIEIAKIDYSLTLSPLLENKLDDLCNKILGFINEII